VSVDNLDGDGFADQPSVIYSFGGAGDDRDDELVRSMTVDLDEVARGGDLPQAGDVTVAEGLTMTGVTA